MYERRLIDKLLEEIIFLKSCLICKEALEDTEMEKINALIKESVAYLKGGGPENERKQDIPNGETDR